MKDICASFLLIERGKLLNGMVFRKKKKNVEDFSFSFLSYKKQC